MSNNKKLGNDFESRFCEILYSEGFWVHNLAQNSAGQPADVIAARNGKTYLIDCKVCSNRGFALSRMEENQDLSMELWKDTGNGDGWFAILLPGGQIYMIPRFVIKAMRNSQSSMSEAEIHECGTPLYKWVKKK